MNNKIRKLKRDIKGITLVALVVTIIVLLILAGVAISFTLGEDGIFKRAQDASKIYENASLNEKTEIDKISNYIDEILNKENEEEIEDVKTVEEAINTGHVFKQNTVIKDAYGNNIKVPAGFKVAEDSGANVLEGIVIEDVNAGDSITSGSQYVWVPIGNVKTNQSGDSKLIELGRYTFDGTTGKETIAQSAEEYKNVEKISDYYQELISSSYGNGIAKKLGDFLDKAKNSNGYYIGRYETGDGNAESADTAGGNNENAKAVVKKSIITYGHIPQETASQVAKDMYSGNNNFTADIVNSYAWDTAIVFIQNFSGDTDYSIQPGKSTTGEWSKTGESILASDGQIDERCNIYDMAGNLWEWSSETSINDGKPCTSRGGGYNSENTPLYRGSHSLNFVQSGGFRTILYL